MTAPLRAVPPWVASLLPGLRGDAVVPAVAELPAELLAATVTAPTSPLATSTTSVLFSGASTSKFRTTLVDLMTSIPMTGGGLQVPTFAQGINGAAHHAEGSAKLEASLTFGGGVAKPGHVATWVSLSDELVEDTAGLDGWLSTYLPYLVKVAEERAVLISNGTTSPIVGFFSLPGVVEYAGSKTDDVEVVADMIGQAASTSGIVPDTVVVSASIWAGLVKSASSVFDANEQTFAGCAVVISPALTDPQILVGPCQTLAVIGREGGIIVEGTRSHATDFVFNKSAIRAASRVALGVTFPSAFVKKTT